MSKNGLFEPFIFKNEHLTKTGSGQTWRNHSKKGPFFLRRAGVAMRFRRIATHSAHSRSMLYGWVRTPFFDPVFLIRFFRCRVLIDTDDHSPRQARDKHIVTSTTHGGVLRRNVRCCSGCRRRLERRCSRCRRRSRRRDRERRRWWCR